MKVYDVKYIADYNWNETKDEEQEIILAIKELLNRLSEIKEDK